MRRDPAPQSQQGTAGTRAADGIRARDTADGDGADAARWHAVRPDGVRRAESTASAAAARFARPPADPTCSPARNPPPVPPRFGQRPPYFGFNFTCTNVPGVQMPQYVAGRKVLQVGGSMMLGR